jgi:hypothetical protein
MTSGLPSKAALQSMSVAELKATQKQVEIRLDKTLMETDELAAWLKASQPSWYTIVVEKVKMWLLWMWGGLAVGVVLLDELHPKFVRSIWYSFGVGDYFSASTKVYQLQTPPSFAFWLPVHIASAILCTLMVAGLVAASYRSFDELTPGQCRIFFPSNLLFMLTILLQIGKLANFHPIVAFIVNVSLLYGLLYTSYSSRSIRQYLAILSIPLILTAIATHLVS